MFNTYSNPYVTFTPIDEQISIWLEANPHIKVRDLDMSDRDAIVYYEIE
jgi:hypothetical protein